MSDEQEMLNRLMQSLSSIDDDLLLDVEPAKRKNVIRMPLRRIDASSAVEVERNQTVLQAASDDRRNMNVRNKRKGWSNRKVLISVASIAACLVVVFGILFVLNATQGARAPEDASAKFEMQNAPGQKSDSHDLDSLEGVVAQNDYLLLLDSDKPVKAIESIEMPPMKPTTTTGDESASAVSREIARLADQSACQVLSGGEVNAVYSPLNLYQMFAFLADSVDSDRLALLDRWDIDVPDEDEFDASSFPYHLSIDEFDAQNSLLMGADLYEKCDRTLLGSLCKRYLFDVYTLESEPDDPVPVVFSQSVDSARWNPGNELLLTFRCNIDAMSKRSLADVNLSEGVFHTSRGTLTDLSFYDSDDASLRHFQLDGAVACELPVEGGNIYLVLPDEDLTPDDLLRQDHFFTRLLTADPAGENAVARFPMFKIADRHNLVGSSCVEELCEFIKMPVNLQWLDGEGVSFPVIDQVIEFSIDGPVHEPDAHGLDAVDRMSLEAVFDRPFIFCLTEGKYNTPILIGVYRCPEW